jgi:lysozyme
MISDELVNSIKTHEGSNMRGNNTHVSYTDTVGVLTIGYGHNLDRGISEEVAEFILVEDIGTAVQEVNDYLDAGTAAALHGARLDVLYEMAFNMGLPRLKKFTKMWQAIFVHDWDVAAVEMLDSKWARQVGQRSATLAQKMQRGV